MNNRIPRHRVAWTGAALAACALMAGCAAPSKREVLSTTQIYPAIGPYSQMVAHGNTLYFSGVLPLNAAGNAVNGTTIEEQTRAVLDFMGAKLRSQGLSYEDVLSTTVYMKDLNEFAAMNKVYGEYFRTAAPARATVEVARLPRDVKIEISAIVGRR
ncbi:Rid family detoxifying hydrolase [Acidovorax sp. NCPPB 3576]|uniref:Rid family detoxifying hydrolase n=1 Tax=Acidovorax sp. NCPPB 3576 TaxID=2940488 RepID=UPI0023494DD3|nr:Rid family detoxifying hydrolase [Acidovorax sp. NCPPB 3576]WCM89512.1 Rid family detoxifying hydrolase [Acidovorax sp. NCPPB 3576]